MLNPVRNYDWGSLSFIQNLCSRTEETGSPLAELWMGAHPNAPSRLISNGREIPLDIAIEADPEAMIGARGTNFRLQYLFKILAAEKPLSIQAHPNKAQAEEGFWQENERRIPFDAPNRNYKDNNHKPELMCALTPFQAMCGFRPLNEIVALIQKLDLITFFPSVFDISSNSESLVLKNLFLELMRPAEGTQNRLIEKFISSLKNLEETDSSLECIKYWGLEFARLYPDDLGILSPIFLNLIELNPFEAIYLEAGILHAYLRGAGVEIMANSDNVLRGGLTSKYIDLDELLHILRFEPYLPQILRAQPISRQEGVYSTKAQEFKLSIVTLSEGEPYKAQISSGAEILLCIEGKARIMDSDKALDFGMGESIFIPARHSCYTLRGKAILFKATTP